MTESMKQFVIDKILLNEYGQAYSAWKWVGMMDDFPLTMEDFKDAYLRWKLGRCPCCGGEVYEWYGRYGSNDEITKPMAIAEGVVYCGRCIAMSHHLDGDDGQIIRMMLQAIADGARKEREKNSGQ